MAKIEFAKAPEGLIGKPYKYYRDWLEVNFFKELCSYCLLHFPSSLHIEHYEPQGYAPERKDDPTNLLLGCPRCNSGKLDYHPKHHKRLRLSQDTSGHSVIDIREEDFSDLFKLKESGELLPIDGDQKKRTIFNITKLLRLDTPKYVGYRKRCFEYLSACEILLTDDSKQSKEMLDVLVKECAERYLFFLAFNVPLSEQLKELIEDCLENNKPKLVS